MFYKQRGFNNRSVTLYLIIINIIVFFIEYIAYRFMLSNFALVPILVTKKYYFWQFFTHMFLHGSIWHLGFNMFALFIFGFPLEKHWGSSKFLKYYIICGLGGGLLHYLINANSPIPSLGASGAVYGLLLAFGMTFPNTILYLNFFIPIKAKYAVIIFGVMELFFGITGAQSGIAHFAHLGGLLTGLIYLKSGKIFSGVKKETEKTKVYQNYDANKRSKNKEHFNEILDKISKKGYDSLSDSEKTELDKLSKEMYSNE